MFWKPMLSFLFAGMLSVPGGVQPAPEPLDIRLILPSVSDPYDQLTARGAEDAAMELGVEVNVLGPNLRTEAQAQADMLQNVVLGMAPDAIVIDPSDAAATFPHLETAVRKGIPILTLNHDVDVPGKSCFLAYDYEECGRLGGEYAAKQSKQAAVLRGSSENAGQAALEAGFLQGLERGGAQVLEVCAAGDNPAAAIQGLMERCPRLGVLCATSDELAIAAQSAVEAAGKPIPVVGFGCSPEALELVEHGKLCAMVAPEPYQSGYLSVQLAVQAARGTPVEERVIPGARLATLENISDFFRAK